MNVELLEQYRSIKQEILEIDARINEIYESAVSLKSPQITGMPRAPGYSTDGLFKIVEKIDKAVEVYQKKQSRLIDQCLAIEEEIDALPSLERRIIRLRYLDGKQWFEIGKIVGYSTAQLYRIHKKIIAE